MINLLYSLIINNKIIYKSISIKNYIQLNNNKNNNKIIFVNYKY